MVIDYAHYSATRRRPRPHHPADDGPDDLSALGSASAYSLSDDDNLTSVSAVYD